MEHEKENKIHAINIDIFGKQISLFFNGNDTVDSKFGKTMSFVYLFIYATAFLMFTFSVFLKKVRTYYDSEIVLEEPPKINLNHDLLYFGFSLQDAKTYNSYIDESIYYPKAYYKKGKRENKTWQWETNEIEIEKCKIEKFGKKYRNIFSKKPLDNLYCIKNINQTLEGNYIYDEYSSFSISIFPCVNNTQNNNSCKSTEEIENKIERSLFSVELPSVGLNPQSFSTPVQPIVENLYTSIGSGFGRKFEIFVELVEIQSDQSFIYETIKKERYLQYSKNIPMLSVKKDLKVENSLCDFELKLSEKIKIQKRSCKKMYTALSNMGGVMIVIRAFFFLISFLPIQTLNELKVVNKLFKIDKSKRELFLNGVKQFKVMSLKSNVYYSFEKKNHRQSDHFEMPLSKKVDPNQVINLNSDFKENINDIKNYLNMNSKDKKNMQNFSCFYKKEPQFNEEKENEVPSVNYIINKDNTNLGNNKSSFKLIPEDNENMIKQFNNIHDINKILSVKKENNSNDQNINKDLSNQSLKIDNIMNFSLRKELSDNNLNILLKQRNRSENLNYMFDSRFFPNDNNTDVKLKLNCLETYFVRLFRGKMKSKNISLFQEITHCYRKYLDVIEVFRNQILFDRIIEKEINYNIS